MSVPHFVWSLFFTRSSCLVVTGNAIVRTNWLCNSRYVSIQQQRGSGRSCQQRWPLSQFRVGGDWLREYLLLFIAQGVLAFPGFARQAWHARDFLPNTCTTNTFCAHAITRTTAHGRHFHLSGGKTTKLLLFFSSFFRQNYYYYYIKQDRIRQDRTRTEWTTLSYYYYEGGKGADKERNRTRYRKYQYYKTRHKTKQR